jgi:hypothetical protein
MAMELMGSRVVLSSIQLVIFCAVKFIVSQLLGLLTFCLPCICAQHKTYIVTVSVKEEDLEY